MAEPSARQLFRKSALVIAYSLFIAFGTAAVLTIQGRPMDARGLQMIAIMALGGFMGALAIVLFKNMMKSRGKIWRFFMTVIVTLISTLLLQGMLTGLQFYATSFIQHEPFTSIYGWIELFFTAASGFVYFYVFGLDPFWPVVTAAAILFGFGFLTLRTENTETYSRRVM